MSFSTEEIFGISSFSSSGLHEENIIKTKKAYKIIFIDV
jgi:hypothetical protein